MEIAEFSGKKIAVLGYGEEGESATKFLNEAGAVVDIFDEFTSEKHPSNVTVSSAESWELDDYDLVVRSPGLSPHRISTTTDVSSATQLFFELCPAQIIGVTGTKGKGTTATLLANILKASKQKVHLLGNIGSPALDTLRKVEPSDIVVYEISSFQLWDLTVSPHVAVVLMVEPEHLDVHEDEDDYLAAKSNISKYQTSDDITIIHPFNELSEQVGMNGVGLKKKFMAADTAHIHAGDLMYGNQKIMPTEEFGLVGPHNRENICAAVTAAWEYTQDLSAIRRAVKAFSGLEHRLELVREVSGVKYYNDSFATTPGAAIAAIKSFNQPEVVILGGSSKQSDYKDLAEAISVSTNIRRVLLIGDTGREIGGELASFGYKDAESVDGDIDEIVKKAAEITESGDVVLLSPASASFDMFDNYKQRGSQYKKAVLDL